MHITTCKFFYNLQVFLQPASFIDLDCYIKPPSFENYKVFNE